MSESLVAFLCIIFIGTAIFGLSCSFCQNGSCEETGGIIFVVSIILMIIAFNMMQ